MWINTSKRKIKNTKIGKIMGKQKLELISSAGRKMKPLFPMTLSEPLSNNAIAGTSYYHLTMPELLPYNSSHHHALNRRKIADFYMPFQG
jgi:hypothetical protein